MSIQFIAGPCGSGKTTYMNEMILERADRYRDRNFLILVPEQFNMQTQKDIVMASPKKGIMNIDVLSFLRLSHRIFDEAGSGWGTVLDDTGKVMVLRRLTSVYGSELTALAGKFDRSGYIEELKSVISEFMEYDIYPGNLEEILGAGVEERPVLGAKLKDLTFIYEKFIDFLGQKYITTEEILDRAISVSDKAPFLENAELYLDGYTGFTPVQLRFLEAMNKRVKRIVVTVTLGRQLLATGSDGVISFGKRADDTDVFSLGINTVYDLGLIAKRSGEGKDGIEKSVTLSSDLSPRLKDSAVLSYLSDNIFSEKRGKVPDPVAKCLEGNDDDIIIVRAGNQREESAWVCRQIYRLVKEKKADFKDIAVITGSLDEYGDILLTEAVKYDIPIFYDRRRKAGLNPLAELIASTFELFVRDFSYQSVVRFLRCGFSGLSLGEEQEFENYILAAGIRRRTGYLKEWKYLPAGYTAESLEILNGFRQRLSDRLEPLYGKLPPRKKARCEDMVTAFYTFFEDLGVYETLMDMSERFTREGDSSLGDEYRQIYEKLMETFDSLVVFLGEEMMTTAQLGDILDSALGSVSVGILPPGAGYVTVGDIKRSRLKEVKYLFLMGVNEGLIPAAEKRGGLLSEMDREVLSQKGITLSAGIRKEAFIQRFYLYMYLSKASKGLRLSFCSKAPDGSFRLPSYLIFEIQKLFSGAIPIGSVSRPGFSDILTKREGLTVLSENLRDSRAEAASRELIAYYIKDGEFRARVRRMIELAFRAYEGGTIGASVAGALYGRDIKGSVTRLESFAACAYSHFLRYGLRLRQRYEYSFEVRDLGIIYHRVLEEYGSLVGEQGFTWADIPDENREKLVEQALDRVLSVEESDAALYDTHRSSYMAQRIRRVMERTISVLTYQIKKGDFAPEGFEMDFTLSGFRGVIDRIDVYRDGKGLFLRIVDYKSSHHELDITDLYEGISLQLYTYGAAAVDRFKRDASGPVSLAGLLYYHINDPIVERPVDDNGEERETLIRRELVMRGYSDRGVITHMDRDMSPKSDVIKVTLKKDGEADAHSEVLDGADMEYLMRFASNKVKELTNRIISGYIKAEPVRRGRGVNARTPCNFCRYLSICGFDEELEGCRYRELGGRDSEEIWEEIRSSGALGTGKEKGADGALEETRSGASGSEKEKGADGALEETKRDGSDS